jgi:hypothetical protein
VGVLCHRFTAAYPVRKSTAGLVFAASAGCVVSVCLPAVAEGVNHFLTGMLGIGDRPALMDIFGRFASDLLLAIAFGLNLFAVSNWGDAESAAPGKLASAIKTLTSYTFSIYLYHVPILILLYAVFPYDPRHPLLHLGYGLTAFVPIVLLARATEHRRDRLRKRLEAGWAFLGNRMKWVPGARPGS